MRGKVVSVFMAVVLALGLCPAPAFAGGGALSAGVVPSGVSTEEAGDLWFKYSTLPDGTYKLSIYGSEPLCGTGDGAYRRWVGGEYVGSTLDWDFPSSKATENWLGVTDASGYHVSTKISSISFEGDVWPTTCKSWFELVGSNSGRVSLENTKKLHLDACKSMERMFYGSCVTSASFYGYIC